MAGAPWRNEDAVGDAGKPRYRWLCRLWWATPSSSGCSKKPLRDQGREQWHCFTYWGHEQKGARQEANRQHLGERLVSLDQGGGPGGEKGLPLRQILEAELTRPPDGPAMAVWDLAPPPIHVLWSSYAGILRHPQPCILLCSPYTLSAGEFIRWILSALHGFKHLCTLRSSPPLEHLSNVGAEHFHLTFHRHPTPKTSPCPLPPLLSYTCVRSKRGLPVKALSPLYTLAAQPAGQQQRQDIGLDLGQFGSEIHISTYFCSYFIFNLCHKIFILISL